MDIPESRESYTDDVTCDCGHTWQLITIEDSHNDQTDYVNSECPECDRDIRD